MTDNRNTLKAFFPEIDYGYWSKENEAFQDTPILSTIEVAITIIRKHKNLDDIILNPGLTNLGLIKIIRSEIKFTIKNNKISDSKHLLRIFDLIQAWGGKTGRGPYVKPKGRTSRDCWESWIEYYTKGAEYTVNSNYDSGLERIMKIPGVGISFATKHLHFWSGFNDLGNEMDPLPIFDNRIRLLLYRGRYTEIPYEVFHTNMRAQASLMNINVSELERALFSFSQNYFHNDSLTLKTEISQKHKMDFNEANKIAREYTKTRSKFYLI